MGLFDLFKKNNSDNKLQEETEKINTLSLDNPEEAIKYIENLPEEKVTPEILSILAKAYNNSARNYLFENESLPLKERIQKSQELAEIALTLLLDVQEHFDENDHVWNFRIAYSYMYLDRYSKALTHFKKALIKDPNDQDTKDLIEDCQQHISLHYFEKPFSERVKECWDTFLKEETQILTLIKENTDPGKITQTISEILNIAIKDISFEVGVLGEHTNKYELFLSPEDSKIELLKLYYFLKQAPQKILENWEIKIGKTPTPDFALKFPETEETYSAETTNAWIFLHPNNTFTTYLYSKPISELLEIQEGKAYFAGNLLLEHTIGEISAMRLSSGIEILNKPLEIGQIPPHLDELVGCEKILSIEEAVKLNLENNDSYLVSCMLNELPVLLEKIVEIKHMSTAEEFFSVSSLVDSYSGYELTPKEDAIWREDIYVGISRAIPLLAAYSAEDPQVIEELETDGINAGYFAYPLDQFNDTNELIDFRTQLEDKLEASISSEYVSFIGGATGVNLGYIDFIMWDSTKFLKEAHKILQKENIPWIAFKSFHPLSQEILMTKKEQ